MRSTSLFCDSFSPIIVLFFSFFVFNSLLTLKIKLRLFQLFFILISLISNWINVQVNYFLFWLLHVNREFFWLINKILNFLLGENSSSWEYSSSSVLLYLVFYCKHRYGMNSGLFLTNFFNESPTILIGPSIGSSRPKCIFSLHF